MRILYTVQLHFTLLTCHWVDDSVHCPTSLHAADCHGGKYYVHCPTSLYRFCHWAEESLHCLSSHCWLSLKWGFCTLSNFTSHYWLCLSEVRIFNLASHCWLCQWGEDFVHCPTSHCWLSLRWGFCTLSSFTSHCWLSLRWGFCTLSNFTSHCWLSMRWGFCTLSNFTLLTLSLRWGSCTLFNLASHCWVCQWGEDSIHCPTSHSPWYNRTDWLGLKHQLTYLLTNFTLLTLPEVRILYIVQLNSALLSLSLRWGLCTLSNLTSHYRLMSPSEVVALTVKLTYLRHMTQLCLDCVLCPT